MGYRQAEPPSDAEGILTQAAKELGIDPSMLTGAGADPYAVFSSVSPTDQVGDRPQSQLRRSNIPLGAQGAQRAPSQMTGWRVRTTQVGEVLKKFYQLSPTQLRRYQALLYAGGFYGNADLTDIQWGQPDEASFGAFSQAVARTVRLNTSGKQVTWSQVISNAAYAAGLDPEALAEALKGSDADIEGLLAGSRGGDVITVALSDPAGLRSTIDKVSSAVLGRKANAAEQRMYVALMHSMQREGQVTQQRAASQRLSGSEGRINIGGALGFGADRVPTPGDSIVEYTQPDTDATAEELLRQQNPGEAGAHDIAIQVANLLEMLNAPVSVPRLTMGG